MPRIETEFEFDMVFCFGICLAPYAVFFTGIYLHFRLHGTRDRTKQTGIFVFFNRFLSRYPRHQFLASPIFTVTFLKTTEPQVTSLAG